jgi:tetratricopeptide (TPR) repeat protein
MKHYEYIEADDYFDMAVEWIRHGDYEKSLSYFKRTIELNPHFVYAYIALARVLATRKNYGDALHALKQAHHIDPGFDRISFLMAKYAYKNGDLKNALMYLDKAIEIDDKPLYLAARDYIAGVYRT